MSQLSILVVDDNQINRDALSRQFQRFDFDVTVAADGQEAIVLFTKHRYSLILLDVNMPGIDGFEVLRWIRRTCSPDQLPVIMVTARNQTQEITEAFKDGANDYVVKPIDFSVLLARVKSHLTRHQILNSESTVKGSASDSITPFRIPDLVAQEK